MRSLLVFLGLVVLCGCTCQVAISQIPPQYLFVDDNCQAVLPDYRTMVTITDNCGIKDTLQTPAPGYVLDAVNQSVEVTIRATDLFGNFTEAKFMVTAKDDKAPVISPKPELLADNWHKINSIYDTADLMLAEQEQFFDAAFDWVAAGIPEDKRATGQYDKKVLSILASPGHAKTGYGSRVFLFQSNNDSYIVK